MASRSTQIRFLLQAIPATERGAGRDSQQHDVSDAAIQARCEAHLAAVDAWAAQGGNDRQVRQAGIGLVAVCAWHAVKGLSDGANMQAFQRASGLSPAQFAASVRDLAPALQRTGSMGIPSSSSANTTSQKPVQFAPRAGMPDLSPAARTPEALAQRAMEIAGGSTSSPFGKRSPATPSRRGRGGTPSHTGSSAARVYRAPTGIDGTSPASTPTRSGLRDRSAIREREVFDPSHAPPVTTPTKRRGRPPSSSAAASPRTPLSNKRVRLAPEENAATTQTQPEPIRAASLSPSKPPAEPVAPVELPIESQPDIPLVYPMTLGYHRHRSDIDAWDATAAQKKVEATLQRVRAMLAAESGANAIADSRVLTEVARQDAAMAIH